MSSSNQWPSTVSLFLMTRGSHKSLYHCSYALSFVAEWPYMIQLTIDPIPIYFHIIIMLAERKHEFLYEEKKKESKYTTESICSTFCWTFKQVFL